jgi:cytochrome d ubiquinol oxidase subunit II
MNSAFLEVALYMILSFSWMVYIIQELFIAGSSALNVRLAKDEGQRKQIQVISGLHFDGVEVWLIAALTIMLGAFPLAFATSLTYLYVVFYLLLYVLITRGVVIEIIYKLDNPKWIKVNAYLWAVSSALIIFFIGVYLTALFYGLPFDNSGLTGGAFGIFNVTTISGGLLFVSLGLTAGSAWIDLMTEGDLGQRAMEFSRNLGMSIVSAVLLLLVFMGMNVMDDSIFVGQIFQQSALFFALPGLAAGLAITAIFAQRKLDAKKVLIYTLLTMFFYLLTGFVGAYPFVLRSSVDITAGITVSDAITQVQSGRIIFIAILVFYPLIGFYQGWKYRKFKQQVKPHDE